MSWYREKVLPYLLDRAMQNPSYLPARKRVGSAAAGRVLEIGVGGGANLPLYTEKVTELFGLDPDRKALGYLEQRAEEVPFAVRGIPGTAESIPLDDDSIDAVVTTLTVCSLPDHDGAMAEIRRVLRPGGEYLFAEHGRAPDRHVAALQDFFTPCTRALGGGCHLNYEMDALIGRRGFKIADLETGYAGRPKAAMYLYQGRATPAA